MANIDNDGPIDVHSDEYGGLLRALQGNIIQGHGRCFTANIFLRFRVEGTELKAVLRSLAERFVTSASAQSGQRTLYLSRVMQPFSSSTEDPLFGSLLLTRRAYEKLGFCRSSLDEWFHDPPEPKGPANATFLTGMFDAAKDLDDEIGAAEREPLEEAYAARTIDGLLLLANDCKSRLLPIANAVMAELASSQVAETVAFEIGEARRNDDGQPMEHFGYADGISQPLFLKSDFGRRRARSVDRWNPFAPLSTVLLRDRAVDNPDAFGSYYVFRKLEQNVRAFLASEDALARALRLEGNGDRAGAMIVGRFRDGTPLALSDARNPDLISANDFRYDGLLADLRPDVSEAGDRLGLKCPFQAHIRKTNPRQSQNATTSSPEEVEASERLDRSRRIARRGITYGTREPGDRPETGVGLLFACFQSSIIRQYAFIQRNWANTARFKIPGAGSDDRTGLDPIIGQPPRRPKPEQHWRQKYGGCFEPEPEALDQLHLPSSHTIPLGIGDFVKFRGGEFFFAPSLTFLLE